MGSIDKKIAVIGLGYVGLPLALAFGKYRSVLGYDSNKKRVITLTMGVDSTKEVNGSELQSAEFLTYSNDESDLHHCGIFIIAVPTPVNEYNEPDLCHVVNATNLVSKYLKKDSLVIYESTVFPGCTEEVCIPILENQSKLKCNKDFFCGYSPERINPGDSKRRLADIVKVTSGSSELAANLVDTLYREIIHAGTFKAASIKVAEASKIMENTQRDINIAFMNEMSMIFDNLGIDISEVLKASETKWNFLPFRPGLVGGHCISVDPYYIIYKSKKLGYAPNLLSVARETNESMVAYIAKKTIEKIKEINDIVTGSKILILGLTFKEDCSDTRNSKVFDIIKSLAKHNIIIDAYDPFSDCFEINSNFDFNLLSELPENGDYTAIIITVGHTEFKNLGVNRLLKICGAHSIIYDVKNILPPDLLTEKLELSGEQNE